MISQNLVNFYPFAKIYLDKIFQCYYYILTIHIYTSENVSKNIPFMIIVFVTIYTSGFGITAGVHRLWSHKAYKAKWPLRLLLVFLFTITGQVCKYLRNNNNLCTKVSVIVVRL